MEQLALLQAFQQRLNGEPDKAHIDKTPDGKAHTINISFIEMMLDELYIGQWSTHGFTSKLIANEVVGELVLSVVHPITGATINRIGAAAIQIMVDKAPEGMQGQEKNRWALSPENKKPNALDMAYPKLKTECLKNAAQSLGKIFGRDLNRNRTDKYSAAFQPLPEAAMAKLVERIKGGDLLAIDQVKAFFILSPEQEEALRSINQLSQEVDNG